MAFNLGLPDALRKARWKVKIRDKETREPPHATIIRGTEAWRINLRTGQFMDSKPDPSEVPSEIIDIITEGNTWRQIESDVPEQSGVWCRRQRGVIRWR